MPCHVEGRGRQCKTLQDCARSGQSFFSEFAGAYFSWLERLPVTQEVAGSRPVAPANFTMCHAAHTARWARFPDQSIQARLLSLIRRN